MQRTASKRLAYHARKVASKRGEWSRFEKEKAERAAKQRHVETMRAVRDVRA